MLMSGLRVFEAGDLAQDLWVVVDGGAEVVVEGVAVHVCGAGSVLGAESDLLDTS